MKNIEYYRNTKDALDAYVGAYRKDEIGDRPFDIWLECEFEEPRKPTLLEAAEAVTTAWYADGHDGVLESVRKHVIDLADAIAREKRKPVLNCNAYGTADEAVDAFVGFTRRNKEIADKISLIDWLYAEAGKEVAK